MNVRSRALPDTPRKRLHRELDRSRLLEAALRVFARHGYHSASIRAIAQEAGFSIGGVYQFVGGKDELYLAILEENWKDLLRETSSAVGPGPALDRLLGFARVTFRHFETHGEWFRVYLSERARLPARIKTEVIRRLEGNRRRLKRTLLQLMREGVEEGLLRPLDPDMLATAYIGVLYYALHEASGSTSAASSAPSPDALVSLFLCGAARTGVRHAPGWSHPSLTCVDALDDRAGGGADTSHLHPRGRAAPGTGKLRAGRGGRRAD